MRKVEGGSSVRRPPLSDGHECRCPGTAPRWRRARRKVNEASELLRERQLDLEGESRARSRVVDAQVAAQRVDKLPADRQAETGTGKGDAPEWSRRRNGSKSVAMTSSGMPRPVSCTVNSTRVRDRCVAATSTEPVDVNFSALVVRFSRTRLSAAGCPIAGVRGRWDRRGSPGPFPLRSAARSRRTDCMTSAIENGTGRWCTSPSPPRASSITSPASALSPNAAL